jgi:F-type H+-transporting ATPase subunit b
MRAVYCAIPLGILLLSGLAGAADGGAHEDGPSWALLGFHALNIGILGAILYRFAGPALRDLFAQRRTDIASQIEAAQARLSEAETELANLRQRIDGFNVEAADLIERVAETAESEKARTIERADAKSARILEDAKRVADSEIERARQVLRAEAAQLAVEIAGEILREQTSQDDDARLIREFTDEIGGSA